MKNLILLIIIIITLFQNFAVHSMNFLRSAAQFAQGVKSYVLKNTPLVYQNCNIFINNPKNHIPVSVAIGMTFYGNSNLKLNNRKKEFDQLPNISPETEKYIKDILEPLDMDTSIIKFKKNENESGASSCDDFIFLGTFSDDAEKLIYRNECDNDETVIFKGDMQHEANHVKYHHRKKIILASSLGLTTFVYAALKKHPLTGLILYRIIVFVSRNYAERQADNNIEDDPKLLRTYAKYFRKYAIIYDEFLSTFEKLIDVHPHPIKRAEEFEARAQAIEEKMKAQKMSKYKYLKKPLLIV